MGTKKQKYEETNFKNLTCRERRGQTMPGSLWPILTFALTLIMYNMAHISLLFLTIAHSGSHSENILAHVL